VRARRRRDCGCKPESSQFLGWVERRGKTRRGGEVGGGDSSDGDVCINASGASIRSVYQHHMQWDCRVVELSAGGK
jgi:hypothetical protein